MSTKQVYRAASEGGFILDQNGRFVAQAIVNRADYKSDQAWEIARVDAAAALADLLNAGVSSAVG